MRTSKRGNKRPTLVRAYLKLHAERQPHLDPHWRTEPNAPASLDELESLLLDYAWSLSYTDDEIRGLGVYL